MTKEAIEYFKFHRKIFCDDHLKICPKDSIAYRATLREKEFYDMAIEALEQEPQIRPKGHWIYDKSIANWICSKCGETPKTIGYVGTGAFMAEHFKYCNHCGAEMEGSDEV